MIDLLPHILPLAAAASTESKALAGPAEPSAAFQGVLVFTLGCLAVAMLVCALRLLKGPTIGDRVISLDQLAHFIVGVIAIFAIQTGRPEIISVAIVMALILFVGTVAFSLYMEKGQRTA